MVPVERVGLVVHGGKEVALAAAREVRRWATSRDIPCTDIDVWDDLDGHRLNAHDVIAALDSVHRGEMTVDARMTLTMRSSRPLEIPDGIEAMLRYGRGPVLPPCASGDLHALEPRTARRLKESRSAHGVITFISR